MSAPTPAEVDEKAAQYYRLKEALDAATEKAKLLCLPLATFKEELIQLVRDFGSAHREKSRLLVGITHQMMVTFGSSVTYDGAAVERFRLALIESNQSRLLTRCFQNNIRWTLSPDAALPSCKSSTLSTNYVEGSQGVIIIPHVPNPVRGMPFGCPSGS